MNRYLSILALLAMLFAAPACSLTGDDDPNDSSKELTVEVDNILITADGNSFAKFTVMYGDKDVSSEAKYYDADTNLPVELPGSRFCTDTPGNYRFWVSYKTLSSEIITITAISGKVPTLPDDPKPSSLNFQRRVLISQFTGTGCGYCPYMTSLLNTFKAKSENKDKYVHCAVHTFNSSDPAYIETNLPGAMTVSSYPSVILNLNSKSKFNKYTRLDLFTEKFNSYYDAETAKAGICASTILDGNQLVVNLGVKAAVDGEIRVAAWLLEDGIYGVQAGALNSSNNTHDNCVRLIFGKNGTKDFSGTSVELKAGESASQFYIMDLDESWVAENCHVIVFVSSNTGTSYTVNNVIDCPVNASVAYDYAD